MLTVCHSLEPKAGFFYTHKQPTPMRRAPPALAVLAFLAAAAAAAAEDAGQPDWAVYHTRCVGWEGKEQGTVCV